jgi:hypothetical protein
MPTTRKPKRRWSQYVTSHSNALTLESGVFARDDPRSIARSLKRSADHSRRRKNINRAGRTLSPTRRRTLERAKVELRRLYGRPATARR